MNFEEIEHTADRAFRVQGRNFAELLENAARAMGVLNRLGPGGEPSATREIELEGTQTEPVRAGITTLIDLAGHSATDPKAARELPDAMQSLRSKKRGR